jgi:ketosteroid isomerase-like protein
MSQENVELMLRLTDAFNRRDVDEVVALWDPEGVWYPAIAVTAEGRQAYHGHAEVPLYFKDVADFAEELHGDLDEVHDLGDQVLALGRLSVKFAHGVELNQEAGGLTVWRNGKCVEARTTSATPLPSKPPGCGSRSTRSESRQRTDIRARRPSSAA